ncbi:Uncharacterised protein [Mycobacteroides abscessus subsp. abscessus]|nr:Uncharacterised protein [Mycobacteroides abscessus subsp. abscessus]
MNHQSVAVAHVAERLGECWPGGVLAAGLVFEPLINLDAVELAFGVLIEGRHPHVADLLPRIRVAHRVIIPSDL